MKWPEELVLKMVDVMERAGSATIKDATLSAGTTKRKGSQQKLEKMRLAEIAKSLLEKALSGGQVSMKAPKFQELGGGNTALQVSLTSMELDFVFKADNDRKLIREARTIDDLRGDVRLGAFRFRLPRVYAMHETEPPYAYLMEHFDDREYPSMKQIFFDRTRFSEGPSPEHAEAIVIYALEALREAYVNSRDPRQQIRMMGEAYYDRIAANLQQAAGLNEAFKSMPLKINGKAVRAWNRALDLMQRRQGKLQQLSPPFVAIVHGDPNPGNILIRREGNQITDIKFIDLKDWKSGDYLFDIAKISHFLLHTGPIEELQEFSLDEVKVGASEIRFKYKRPTCAYVQRANSAIESKIRDIAEDLGDNNWKIRYPLALASNILGLIPRRWSDGLHDEALVLYAEGMTYLDTFTRQFEQL
jgi:hypothetical protein